MQKTTWGFQNYNGYWLGKIWKCRNYLKLTEHLTYTINRSGSMLKRFDTVEQAHILT